ncbi:hypothetical protein SUDANB121_04596 [Nocardiopsis dassonvillei]
MPVYLCRIPENTKFATRPGAPEQPDGIADDACVLFPGNEVYLLACPDHCDPAAVRPVNRNRGSPAQGLPAASGPPGNGRGLFRELWRIYCMTVRWGCARDF